MAGHQSNNNYPWWRHQMETFSALLAICAGNSPISGEFPPQRPVTWSFDVFYDLRLIKRLSKHSRGWWLETLSRPLWRHCNSLRRFPQCPYRQFLDEPPVQGHGGGCRRRWRRQQGHTHHRAHAEGEEEKEVSMHGQPDHWLLRIQGTVHTKIYTHDLRFYCWGQILQGIIHILMDWCKKNVAPVR